MNTVTVRTSKEYQVHIGSGLLSQLGRFVCEVCQPGIAVIISDSKVWPLYGNIVEKSLLAAGFRVIHYAFSAGEASKNGNTYLDILNFLAENHLTRSDCLVALGGGVVGDMTGFVAATFLRGIPYIQIPTTVLAAVDSSVGGKTAIDLPAGKNLAGAFYQPHLVLCDTDTLSTLPASVFQDGCAEVIKYGVLYDVNLFSHLEHFGLNFDRNWVITRCIELKRDVVIQDEFDTGERMKLNLGHTIGHSIERISNFDISHGRAVAIGMAIVSRACQCPDTARIISCLKTFGLPFDTTYTAQSLFSHALSDKKRSGDTVSLILPRQIGLCEIVPTPVEKLLTFIEEGL